MIGSALAAVVVAFLWGATTPLLKTGAHGVERVAEDDSWWLRPLRQAAWLARRPRFVLPWLANQLGSVVFFLALAQGALLSVLAPVSNTLALAVSVVVGSWLAREQSLTPRELTAVALVAAGSWLCSL